jgi:small subunit ribosomal protein S13
MNGRTQDQVKQRRKTKSVNKPGKRGHRSRRRRRKRRKRTHPHYVRGVPRRPGRPLEKGLRSVYGLGRVKAREVCRACGRRPSVKVGNLDPDQIQLMEGWRRENLRCASDRRRKEFESIQRHLKLGTFRGIQRRRGLPVRGQRTSTNGMTARRLNKQRGTKVR